jgi:hypothetical protein
LEEVVPLRFEGFSSEEWIPGIGIFSRILAANESR